MSDVVFPTKFLIDGIDRLGKSTLIKNIQDMLGYHLVVHYDKPKMLAHFLEVGFDIKNSELSDTDFDESYKLMPIENLARRLFQEDANQNMFNLLKTNVPIIFDRTHLGEMVYAPLYRGYSGDYVLDLEKDMLESKPYTSKEDIKLILLTSSNTDMLKDDGLSFDPQKKNQEQEMFIQAFNRSKIQNKIVIDVHDGNGNYKSYLQILEEALHKNS